MLLGLPEEFVNEIKHGFVSRHPKGLLFYRKKLVWTGLVYAIKGGDDEDWTDVGHNLITDEGANHMLDVALHGTSPVTTWYIAPFSNNVSPAQTLTAATFHSTLNELNTEYSESGRVAYNEAAAASRTSTNVANAATFTAAQDNVTIYGVGVFPSATKRSTTAPLLSVRKFASAFNLPTTGSNVALTVTHSINYVADA